MRRSYSPFPCRIVPQFLAAACTGAFGLSVLFSASTCSATTITFTESGISAAGTPLTVSARIDTALQAGIDNYALKITLQSYGAATMFPADVLTSFYFNIADPITGERPVLTYQSGSGSAYELHSDGTDYPVRWVPNLVSGGGTWTRPSFLSSDLVAKLLDNEGWQFKTLAPPPAFPGLGFGIGTVGNSNIGMLIPGATEPFDGDVVKGVLPGSMINLGIYSDGTANGTGGDISPANSLDGANLVRTQAVFMFTSDKELNSVDQTWVQGNVTFGFGTNPDSVLFPEPGSLAMAATGGLLVIGWLARGRKRVQSSRPQVDHRHAACALEIIRAQSAA
jgi:hypothetical protein